MSKELRDNPKLIGSVNLEVGDGGMHFEVVDEGFGPTVKIRTSHFGNLQGSMKVHTTNEGLQALSDLFARAAKEKYSREYVHKAYIYKPSNTGDGENTDTCTDSKRG